MQPMKMYDYLVLSRAWVLDRCRGLPVELHSRRFPIGMGSLDRILTHIVISEWYYIERLEGRHVEPYDQWPVRAESPPPLATIESMWKAQEAGTRAAMAAVRDWDGLVEYRVVRDDGRRQVVTASKMDLAVQLVLHEVHHRAQVLNILRQAGVEVVDLDYNTMMYTRVDEV